MWRATRRFCFDRPNECWQSDWTRWWLADGIPVGIARDGRWVLESDDTSRLRLREGKLPEVDGELPASVRGTGGHGSTGGVTSTAETVTSTAAAGRG